jgi:hypothetical protein
VPYGTGPHDVVVQVVAELTVNAVRHGTVSGRDFRLCLRVRHPTARIEVTDTRGERLPPLPAEVRSGGVDGPRGLVLVAGLAERWGWVPREDGGPGKTVWAECAVPRGGDVPAGRTSPRRRT